MFFFKIFPKTWLTKYWLQKNIHRCNPGQVGGAQGGHGDPGGQDDSLQHQEDQPGPGPVFAAALDHGCGGGEERGQL